jgi:hypothetical protein
LNESCVGNNQWFVGNLAYLLNLQCGCHQTEVSETKTSSLKAWTDNRMMALGFIDKQVVVVQWPEK